MTRSGSRAGTRCRTACARAASRGSSTAYGEPRVPEQWRETVLKVIRQRLSQHEHPDARRRRAARWSRARARSGRSAELAAIAVPTAIVASDDEADPEHPRAVGEAYAAAIPGARLVTDEPGGSPVAWQGSQLSKVIAESRAEQAATEYYARARATRGTPLVRKLGIKPGSRWR